MASKARKERRRMEFILNHLPKHIAEVAIRSPFDGAVLVTSNIQQYRDTALSMGRHLTKEEWEQVVAVKRKLAGLDNPYETANPMFEMKIFPARDPSVPFVFTGDFSRIDCLKPGTGGGKIVLRKLPAPTPSYGLLDLKSLDHNPANL